MTIDASFWQGVFWLSRGRSSASMIKRLEAGACRDDARIEVIRELEKTFADDPKRRALSQRREREQYLLNRQTPNQTPDDVGGDSMPVLR